MELEPSKDTSDPPPPSYTSVSNGNKDVEDGRKQASSTEEQSKDGGPTEKTRRTMTKKDVTCLLGVILAITLLTCAFVACVVVGLKVVGPYCTAGRFTRSNCTNVSSTMGKETYTCSCGKHCTKQCTRNCLRVTVSYSDPSSGEEYLGLFRVDETGLDSECYSTSDNIDPIPSPVSCWYNPDDKQQAIEHKRFQLYEAVHSLFWPLLVCVLSIAFIIPYFVLLAQGRLSCQCKCSPRTVSLLTAFRTCAVSAQM